MCKHQTRSNWLINNQHLIWRWCKNKLAHCFFNRTLNKNLLWTSCMTLKRKRYVTIFVSSECHIFKFLNLSTMKLWCRFCYFKHCIVIWIMWIVSLFVLVLNVLSVQIALIRRLRRFFEKSFQLRKWFEFVTQNY